MTAFSSFRSVLLALTACLWMAGCGSKEKEIVKPPRKLELRVSVAGTEPYAYGQRLPTAYVSLWGPNIQYTPVSFYSQEAPNGTYVAFSEGELPVDSSIEFTVQLRSLGGAPLAQAGTSVRAGVYFNDVLQKELVLDNTTVTVQNTGCSGSGASKACQATSPTLSFVIR